MARRKPPATVPAEALGRDVPEILDRILAGQQVDVADLQVAGAAAAALRRNWLKDLSEAIGFLQTGTPQFEAFKNCTQSMLTLFVQHGLVSADEAQKIWMAIEERS